jgi:serine/threonine protein kinase
MLMGLRLDNGWEIVNQVALGSGATGSNFSVGYIVRKPTGEQGFLKALDYVTRLQFSSDPARDLQAMTEAFNFERDILAACRSMSRVITAIEEGAVTIPGIPFGTVQYLILELADGDARGHIDAISQFDVAWALRALHHVAVGLFQMHRGDVAHQDVKPSNVLIFDGGSNAKIGDLGRAAARAQAGPFDGQIVAGDPQYAPPETLYGEALASWNARRVGCDVYHLGSMISFFFSRSAMTPLILRHLDPSLWPAKVGGGWGGSYADVLPKLRAAFERAVRDVEASLSNVNSQIAREVLAVVRQLCDPDPALRGHPRTKGRTDTPLALERYVAILDRLARTAEFQLRRGAA